MIVPVWNERALYRTLAKEYDQALLDIREAIAKAPVWEIVPPDVGKTAPIHSKHESTVTTKSESPPELSTAGRPLFDMSKTVPIPQPTGPEGS